MKGKVIMNLAMSIDGYIATEEGDFDWIKGHDTPNLDTKQKHDYQNFLSDIDIVVMGKNSYDLGFAKDYKDKKIYVATNEKIVDEPFNINFIGGNIVDIILEEKYNGKNIFLFGGGLMIDNFIKEDAIDKYIVGLIPIILGKGRKLFLENNPTIKLTLENYIIDNGVVIVEYNKKADFK